MEQEERGRRAREGREVTVAMKYILAFGAKNESEVLREHLIEDGWDANQIDLMKVEFNEQMRGTNTSIINEQLLVARNSLFPPQDYPPYPRSNLPVTPESPYTSAQPKKKKKRDART